MGRLIGISLFFSSDAYEEEKQDARDLRSVAYDPEAHKPHQVQIARRMHKLCMGHIIHCTAKSLDWKGDLLISLPPCHIIKAYLDLTE